MNCGLRQNVEQSFAIQAFGFAKRDSLGNRLHLYAENRLDHQLHAGSRAGGSHQAPVARDRLKNGLSGLKDFAVAADEQNHGALLDCGSAA